MASERPAAATSASAFSALLSSHVRAGSPLLGLQTHEEERAIDRLAALARELDRELVTTRAEELGPEPDAWRPTLEAWAKREEPALFVAVDLHPYLEQPAFVRALRVLSCQAESRSQTLVLLAPELPLPRELEQDLLILDLPLPDAGSLRRLAAAEGQSRDTILSAETLDGAVRALQGLTLRGAQRTLSRAFEVTPGLREGDLSSLIEDKRAILGQSDVLEMVDAPPSMENIGGLSILKSWLTERQCALGDAAARFGLPAPRGLLLVGVQGCGKSLSAKAVAHHWNLPLVRLDFGAVFGGALSPEAALRRAQRLTSAMAPVVLWIDEIDKAFGSVQPKGRSRSSEGGAGSATVERLCAGFLTWLQERQSPVFVVATANEVEHLPPELLRKGRFDEVFFIDLPTASEREQILSIHLSKKGRDAGSYELADLARRGETFTGAELEAVVTAGLFRAFKRGSELTSEDLRVAMDQTVPLYRTYEEPIKALRAWAKTRARRASTDLRLTDLWAAR